MLLKRCKRNHVSSSTVAAVGTDIWLLICLYLDHSPHAVFRLLTASKSLFEASSSSTWWSEFFGKVVAYQKSLKRSNYLRRLLFFESLSLDMTKQIIDKRRALGLVFGIHCHYCGARYGHTFVKPLMKRACPTCLQRNLICNKELFFRYGISYSDFIEDFICKRGIVLPIECFHIKRSVKNKGAKIFFLKSELQMLLGFDLEAMEILQSQKKKAAKFLTSRIVRLADQIQAAKYQNTATPTILEKVNRHMWHNKLRVYSPLKIDKTWIPGGPTYAKKGSPLHCWRKGFNVSRSRKISSLTIVACASAVQLGRLPLPNHMDTKIIKI
jgi:hypothetical protein